MEHSIKWMFYPPNDPQINVGAKLATSVTPTSSRGGPIGKKFKTNAHANSRLPSMEGGKAKHCSFNGRGSHFLEECKAFCAKKLEEGAKWVISDRAVVPLLNRGTQTETLHERHEEQNSHSAPPQRNVAKAGRWKISRNDVHICVWSYG